MKKCLSSQIKPYSLSFSDQSCDKTGFDPFAKIRIETSSNAISKHWSSFIKFLHEYLIKPKHAHQRPGKVTITTCSCQVRQELSPADPLLHLLITQPKWEKENKIKGKFS